MRAVIALGGNALLERGERPEAEIQEQHVASAVAALATVLHQTKPHAGSPKPPSGRRCRQSGRCRRRPPRGAA